MNTDNFENLPFILKPAQMRELCGCNKEGLRALREAHPQIVFRKRGKRHGRGAYEYLKTEVAKVLHL